MEITLYHIALEKANQLMEDTGIRRYCTKVCKGNCCGGRYGTECSKYGCHAKLPCAIYICENLYYGILYDVKLGKNGQQRFTKQWKGIVYYQHELANAVRYYYPNPDYLRRHNMNLYFYPYDYKPFANLRIKWQGITLLNKDIARIREYMERRIKKTKN